MAKPIELQTKHRSNSEKQLRKNSEESLKGNDDNIKPLPHLNSKEKKFFNFIVNELKASGILSNLDIFTLSYCAISINGINECDIALSKNPFHKDIMAAKTMHTKDFQRYSSELGLSPSSRAKIAGLNMQAKQDSNDPLLVALKGNT